jgi:hypothetical protein
MTMIASKYFTPWSPDDPPDWKVHNRGITPVFFIEPIQCHDGPRDMEFVRILVAGDGLSEPCQPVDDAIKERFSEEYKAWQENRETADAGYSFDECSFVNNKQARELESFNIFNLRDLAAVTDGNLHAIPRGRALREKAIAWLADREGSAPFLKMAEENAATKAENAALKLRVEKLEKLALAPKKKPKKRAPVSPETRAKLKAIMLAKFAVRKAPVPPPEGQAA